MRTIATPTRKSYAFHVDAMRAGILSTLGTLAVVAAALAVI